MHFMIEGLPKSDPVSAKPQLRVVTRIVIKIDVVVNYVYAAICGDMLVSYRTVSAERDKMCQIHPEP